MTQNPNVYGYVNGKPVFSRDEFIFEHRKRGPIEDDAELIAFAEKATSGWHNAGWSHGCKCIRHSRITANCSTLLTSSKSSRRT